MGDCCGSPLPRDFGKDSQTMAQKIEKYHEAVNMAIEEMKGWRLGEFPSLLPYDNDSDDDFSDV